jgi:hypothetical protein
VPELFSVAVPSVVPALAKVTVPLGVPVPDDDFTVAVKVTLPPKTTLAEETASVVAVAGRATLTLMAAEAEGA